MKFMFGTLENNSDHDTKRKSLQKGKGVSNCPKID